MRAITSAAGVNLGAVNYHFGSKEGLFEGVVHWRIAPVNQETEKRLEQLEARVGAETPSVEEILEAYVAPVLTTWQDQPDVPRLIGRLYGEPHSLVHPLLEREFGDLSRRFLATLIPGPPVRGSRGAELALPVHDWCDGSHGDRRGSRRAAARRVAGG